MATWGRGVTLQIMRMESTGSTARLPPVRVSQIVGQGLVWSFEAWSPAPFQLILLSEEDFRVS